ncbi:hypothetical protein [Sulfitobacter sp.]|uniref:hypothetical protein n=1 Tax=Sulfitobacter sp. TaxID=1903071 RepID=UPI0032645410
MAQIRAALVLDIVVNDTCNTAEDEHPMMNSNKILTVSYGTFSCTLEGFDDSFGTMKAIAEYFRDLASDDRYFGAEPPQPDAEMLTRIAQREVSRRVQAREQEGKIVLSALENQSAEAPAQAPPAAAAPAAAAAAPAQAETAAPQAPAAAEPAPVQEETPAPLKAEIADTAAVEATAAAEPQIAEAVEKAEPAPAAESAPAAEAEEEDTSDAEAFFAASPQPQSHYEDEAQAASVEEIPAASAAPADSIAAKLQRIRAVVAQQDEDEAASYDEEEAAAPQVARATAETQVESEESQAAIDAARRDIEDALDADEATEMAQDEAEEDDDDLADILNRLEAEEEDEAEVAETDESLFDAEDEEEPKAEAALEIDAADLPRKGRVIKVKRADLEAAVARGDLEEVSDPAPQDAPAAQAEEARSSSLSPEDEDELARELAALEAELGASTPAEAEETPAPAVEMTEPEAAPVEGEPAVEEPEEVKAAEQEPAEVEAAAEPIEEQAEPAQAARHSLPTIDDETGPDMSRLMAETDSKMDEAESTTRRDAFAHLRAAVAAKKADEAMGGRATTTTSDDAYREDLADVVRPRRPVSRSARTERPKADARSAPLKLVAEQRIDVDKLRSAGPVRPRRVAAVVEPVKTNPDAESFADFAADMGATKLPELLEAAASYMSFVEGRDQFSRPQLMGKVRSIGLPDFTREDGLRSFGQLLRAGKIEKIKGGRFTVSDEIGYRPDHRAVG